MAEVPKRICELVETFDQHIEAYRSSQYNEAQVRREFIDPFFEELGLRIFVRKYLYKILFKKELLIEWILFKS